MKLRRVSISGIDESAAEEELKEVYREFPFVEWGLLIYGGPPKPRYPSADWRNRLLASAGEHSFVAHLEAEICRTIFAGKIPPDLHLSRFRRVQLNLGRQTICVLQYFMCQSQVFRNMAVVF